MKSTWPKQQFAGYKPRRLQLEDDGAPPADDWLFQTGLARCGTSALSDLVSAHPQSCVVNEGYFWQYTETLADDIHYVGPYEPGIHHFRIKERMGIAGRPYPASRVRAFFEGIRQMIAPEALIFGDKAGWLYHTSLAQLQIVFPACRFLHITRNEWDHTASLMNWGGWLQTLRGRLGHEPSAVELAEHSVRHARTIKQEPGYQWLMLNAEAENIHHVSYEDLAENGKATIEGILDWLGLDAGTYDWTALDRTRYATTTGKWQQVPELVRLRKEEEGQ